MRWTEFDAQCIPEIPPLAWLLDLSHAGRRPALYHGRHVDVFENAFIEGTWDGNFLDAGFEASANVFGSGAKIGQGSALFVTPSHTLEPLVVSDRVASNSLVFLSAYRDLDFSPIEWRAGEFFASILLGLDDRARSVRTRSGSISFIYHHNFAIDGDGGLKILPKPLPPRFPSFGAYVDYLSSTSRDVCTNAADQARARRYYPLTTLSSGYDSTAAAVIAKALGCQQAISLKQSQHGEPDTGSEVAKILDLDLREFERTGSGARGAVSEAEFLSAGMQGEDYSFMAFADSLSGTLLFTGFHGDKIWDKSEPPSDRIKRGDISGCSLGEFRLARDFLHFPVPFIACQRHVDIHSISNSEEMVPHSVGGPYDRPIPRRIAEEAGVEREMFGQRKRATSLLLHRHPKLLSESTQADLTAFRKTLHFGLQDRLQFILLAGRWHVGMALLTGLGRLQRLKGSRYRAVKYPRAVARLCYAALSRLLGRAEVFEHGHPRNVIWQRWAIGRVKERYAAVRRATGSTSEGIENPRASAKPAIQSRLNTLPSPG